MDLTASESDRGPAHQLSSACAVPHAYRNDAFSFWKPPEAWRPRLAGLIEESERRAHHYLFEEYLEDHHRRPSRMLDYYYTVKGLIPVILRHWLNSIAISSRARPSFPDWPCEDALLRIWRRALSAMMEQVGVDDAWHVGFWPQGKSCCIVLTHDVESPRGLAAMEKMAALEERYGLRSAWNLALDQYPIDWRQIDALRARGFEFGAHGLRHDGRLFRSERDFQEQAARIRFIAREHGLRGFRSPSTLRRVQWIPRLGFDFDSSFSDSDIFEPQPGGTCSIFPFFIGAVVELPYTLPQDHTLIHLLGRDLVSAWIRKARWIASLGGMILTLIHPDYCGDGIYFQAYERLLAYLCGIEDAWHALPSQVARWWRRRAYAQLHLVEGEPRIVDRHAAATARLLSQEPLAYREARTWPGF